MIKEIGEKLGFESEANQYLQQCYEKMFGDVNIVKLIGKAADKMFSDDDGYTDVLEEIVSLTAIKRYSVDLVFYMLCTKPLHYIYKVKGLCDELYWDTVSDLKYKLAECKNTYGIYGVATNWFGWFYTLKRFKLGRLEYEKQEFAFDDYKGIIKKGDTVINCHIPSSEPLSKEKVIDSLKQAYAFYNEELKNGVLPIVCSSWLLYPPHYEVFAPGSNLRTFYDMFDVIDEKRDELNKDFWRIFNMNYDKENLDILPCDTSLRKGFIKYFANGNCMGSGFGVLLFDGNRIIKD